MYTQEEITNAVATARNHIRIDGDVAYVTLTQGKESIIDTDDIPLIAPYRWCASRTGCTEVMYAATRINGENGRRVTYMQRILFAEVHATNPGTIIDHFNRDGLDNRRVNLRPTTHQGNMLNKKRYSRSRNPDVTFRNVNKANGRFTPAVRTEGQLNRYPRSFTEIEEAAMRADLLMLEMRGDMQPTHNLNFAHLSPLVYEIIQAYHNGE